MYEKRVKTLFSHLWCTKTDSFFITRALDHHRLYLVQPPLPREAQLLLLIQRQLSVLEVQKMKIQMTSCPLLISSQWFPCLNSSRSKQVQSNKNPKKNRSTKMSIQVKRAKKFSTNNDPSCCDLYPKLESGKSEASAR